MINAIILEDEQNLGDELNRILKLRCREVNIVAICYNLEEFELALKQFHPDLAFMDIELGKGQTSFELLTKISPINFGIIFTTAHNKYAIQAVKFSAIDYLLKPVDEEELVAAVEKFESKKNKADSGKIESLLSAWINPGSQQNKMHLPTVAGFDQVTVSDIIYCEGIARQTLFTLTNKEKIVSTLTLKQCEEILTPYRFMRIHKSYLMNLNHVKKYVKGKDGTAIASNDSNLTVSRDFKEKFIERLRLP